MNEVSDEVLGSEQPYASDRYARLVLNLGRALLHVGSPAHRLESSMQIMAERLGLQAEFFSTPTALIVSLGDGENQQTFLARSEPGSANLSKLADLTEVMEDLAEDRIDPVEADDRVRRIDAAPPLYGAWLQVLAFILIGGGVAPLLGGGWREAMMSAPLGAVTGLTVWWMRQHVDRSRLIMPMVAALITFLGSLWCGIDGRTALMPAILAAMIPLLPGMDLTTAARELSTGHLVSGSSRLSFSVTIFALLAFGLVLGGMAGQALVGPVELTAASARPGWLLVAGLVMAAFGLMMLIQAHMRDWFWILLVSFVAWIGSGLGGWLEAPIIGAFVGGLSVGLLGNLYVHFSGRPSSILHIPGLILLVPGSIGLRSLATLLQDDVVAGVETAILAGITAVALTTGMILASVLVPPRTTL
ncbi:threonine/serine exporter family protein [Wenzhouxiangella sp. EGI_FJ10305]|uniref:threonine/serine ThrE exporter family protein n=1 Tax=Wenzhouxiangella sp. EGI_FJ10305 TaxID=3243768 RepID=UPI0035E0C942